ncbi:MAG: hypothetical protein ACI9G1_000019 [Pirellulaceae bacterium]
MKKSSPSPSILAPSFAALIVSLCCYSVAFGQFDTSPLPEVQRAVPHSIDDLAKDSTIQLQAASQKLIAWAVGQSNLPAKQPEVVLARMRTLFQTKQILDNELNRCLELRLQFAKLQPEPKQRLYIQNYLRASAQIIDLNGRFRYLLRDTADRACYELDTTAGHFEKLIDILTEFRVGIGALSTTYALFDPVPNSGSYPFPVRIKMKVLQLIALTRNADCLSEVVDFIRENKHPALTVYAASTIRFIGLPQTWRPGQDARLAKPLVSAEELLSIVNRVNPAQLTETYAERLKTLKLWLSHRVSRGIVGDTFRWGEVEVQPGDWLLTRSASPYSRFTDLSPGLFTHIGVVATETGSDGQRRFVVVDLPERGATMPSTNFDSFLQGTVHYAVLRFDDQQVAEKMATVAQQLIGKPIVFDLQFQTNRLAQYKNNLNRLEFVHTYCAGLPYICAQETTAPIDQFFPIRERAASQTCVDNLRKLGLAIGDNFASPTGAMFSEHMKIAGFPLPMYDPTQEVKEAIYNHFADSMLTKSLTPSPTALQLLRERVAVVSKQNPYLAKAMAAANSVDDRLDLESAAKAIAVIESLDDIAISNARQFDLARSAVVMPAETGLKRITDAVTQELLTLQRIHSQLRSRYLNGSLSSRQLRIELVNYYAGQGKGDLDRRFFRP